MSTKAYIFIEKENNMFDGVYVHWDGYLSGVGQTLFKNYRETEKIQTLISLGALSYLDAECCTPPNYKRSNNHINDLQHIPGYTVAYNRDRGDPLNIEQDITIEDLTSYSNSYIWRNNTWWQLENNNWSKLEENLKKLEIDNNNFSYTVIPSLWNMVLSESDFIETVGRGFIITNNTNFKLHDSILFKANDSQNLNKQYEFRTTIIAILDEEGLKEGYKLIMISYPPKDIYWHQSIIK